MLCCGLAALLFGVFGSLFGWRGGQSGGVAACCARAPWVLLGGVLAGEALLLGLLAWGWAHGASFHHICRFWPAK